MSTQPDTPLPTCPICCTNAAQEDIYESRRYLNNRECVPTTNYGGLLVHCRVCGDYAISKGDVPAFGDDASVAITQFGHELVSAETKNKLSSLLKERHIQRRGTPYLQLRDQPFFQHSRRVVEIEDAVDLVPLYYKNLLKQWPSTVGERIDRALCNLARMSESGGQFIKLNDHGVHSVFAKDGAEAEFALASLVQYGFLDRTRQTIGVTGGSLTAEGWKRFEELRRTNSPENPVFVAMWYGIEKNTDGSENHDREPEMTELYRKILEAVQAVGYKAIRADLNQHNNFIMDQVIADIKEAPFVISDLSGHRNGVYFEAGFARGLNLEVIHTCKDTDFADAHFDVKQINTIKWATPGEIVQPLMDRIRATVGRGPHGAD